jgi:hypothetical protein
MRVGIAVLALGLASQAAPPGPEAEELAVQSEDPPFQAKLPRGYRLTKDPKAGYVYERKAGPANWETVRVRVFPLDGEIPEGASPAPAALAKPAAIPADAKLVALKDRWGEFAIDAVEARFVVEITPYYARVAHVPLLPRGVALFVVAPEPLEAEARADLARALQTLTGKTHWATRQQKERLRQGELALYGACGLAVLYAAGVVLFFRGRPMSAHLFRTLALVAIGMAFFVPMGLGHPWGLPAMAGGLLYFSLAGRRLKMAIDA